MSSQSTNIVFTGQNAVEVWREDVPEPRAGQILVGSQKSLISTGTECICLARKFAPGTHWDSWVKYPFHTGYSNAGRVLAVGEGVTKWKVGDRVACRWQHRQSFVIDADEALAIPDGVSDEAATWFGLATIVQNGVRRAEHTLGDAVVVIGLGLLGQLVVQYLRCFGAREIIAVDTSRPRLDMARAHGATHALESDVAGAREAVSQITGGRLADVVYDVTGHPAVFSPALGLARKFGKLLLLGDTGTPSEQRLTGDVVTRGVSIIGAHDSNPPETATDREWWTKPHMAELFFSFLERGQMEVGTLVTHRYSPNDAPAAYEMLLTDRSGAMGVIFDWTQLEPQN